MHTSRGPLRMSSDGSSSTGKQNNNRTPDEIAENPLIVKVRRSRGAGDFAKTLYPKIAQTISRLPRALQDGSWAQVGDSITLTCTATGSTRAMLQTGTPPRRCDNDYEGWSGRGQSPSWALSRSPQLLESSLPGVFAVGDVRAGSVKRVASAVGEGATSISLVHRAVAEF